MSKVVLAIFMAYVSLLTLGLMDNIRGPFYPDILNTLNLGPTKGSLFFAVASFAALGGNFFGTFLLHRVIAQRLMNYSIFGMGLGFWLIARSTDFISMVTYCTVFGFHFGMLNVSQNVVVQQNAPPLYRRRIFNGLHAMYGLAALFAPLLASGFLQFGWNWMESFSFIGFASALIGFLFLLTGWRKFPRFEPVKVDSSVPSFSKGKALFLAAALAFYVMGELSLSTRLPLWLREIFFLSPKDANSYMALFCGGLFLSRMLFTFVPFSRFSNSFILSASVLSAALVYAVGLLTHPFVAALSGVFMGPFYPVIMDEMSRRYGAVGGRVIGWGITLSSIFIVIMHFTLGVLTDLYGIENALWLGVGVLIGSAISLRLSGDQD